MSKANRIDRAAAPAIHFANDAVRLRLTASYGAGLISAPSAPTSSAAWSTRPTAPAAGKAWRGLTWRTPWSGQLTVGAENVVTRGKNPFSTGNAETDEGTVPYVRYEQDL